MLLKPALAAALALAVWAPPQPLPDMFSCMEPSRLTAGTMSFAGGIGNPITHTTALERDSNQNVIRMTWKASASTEQVTTLDAASLRPMHFLMRRGLDTEPQVFTELAIIDGELRGFRSPNRPRLALPTNGEPVIFSSGYLLQLLARAVNWERCPSVRARYLDDTAKLAVATLKRTGTTTLPYQGVPVSVFEIEVAEPGFAGKIWVTQTAPYVTMKFTGVSDLVLTLVSKQTP